MREYSAGELLDIYLYGGQPVSQWRYTIAIMVLRIRFNIMLTDWLKPLFGGRVASSPCAINLNPSRKF
jgi:hypothetical protein